MRPTGTFIFGENTYWQMPCNDEADRSERSGCRCGTGFSNRYITFQMAGVPVSRQTFVDILSLIARAPGHHSHPHMGTMHQMRRATRAEVRLRC